jgi:hypothetical protein
MRRWPLLTPTNGLQRRSIKEQNSFKQHEVLELVPRDTATRRGKKIFQSRLVLDIKVDPPSLEHPLGSINKFKYRMTIAAFTKMMRQGIDYEEKYASTVRWTSLKILLAIAVQFDFDIVIFDIVTFFLYGKLTDEVYMEQPADWVTPEKPADDFICLLRRSMYGLP